MKAGEIQLQKEALRKHMQEQRNNLSVRSRETASQQLSEQLLDLVKRKKPRTVHSFLPMDNEVNILPFVYGLLKSNVMVVAPKTLKSRKLQHLVLHTLEDLETGIFGTRHPASAKVYHGEYDLILVPGLAFDRHGNRLGYGGGYYDSFLKNHPEAYKVAVAYPFQLVDEIPTEEHDLGVDLVLTAGG